MRVNRKFENGFTLVELLAVIVMLAVILTIAIPSISNIMDVSTKSLFEVDAKTLLKLIDYKMTEDTDFNPTTINESNISTKLANISTANYNKVTVNTTYYELYILIEGKNKWNGLTACGTKDKINIVSSSDVASCENIVLTDYDAAKGVNRPKLARGMVPIKWDGTKWENTTESDTDWYNYDTTNKKWANAKTADGSFWVWIPRYIYKISSGWHTNSAGTIDVQFSKGIDDNWNSAVIGNVDTGTTSNSSDNRWTNHPAFTFDTTQLTGIWVAKFEASISNTSDTCYTSESAANCDKLTLIPKMVPNVKAWRYIDIGKSFTAIRNMETRLVYGWAVASGLQSNGSFTTDTNNIDTHLMKNIEWGAVSYLSKSTYGQNTNEIWINNSNQYITGCAGNSVSSGEYDGCQNTYETTNGVKASTTGNIYGIYDMSGGEWERVSAYVDNANSSLNNYGLSIISASFKYKDIYTQGTTDTQKDNYTNAIKKKGDAVYETSNSYIGNKSWFGDYSEMPETNSPWFVRGGNWSDGFGAGPFTFDISYGNPVSGSGFRPVLVVNAGL